MRLIGKKMMAALLAGTMMFTTAAQTVASAIETNYNTPADVSVSDEELTIEATNSFGSILAKEISAEQTEQLANNGCNVFSIEMDGTQANVEFQTVDDCTLVVGVYDESGETLLATGSTEVLHDQTEAVVSIEIDAMPEYFYLKGYLIDPADLAPMCTVYENPNYTQKMQEFFSKTVEDFDAERVLNFDDDPANNFAVYKESTILIPQNGEGYNVVASADDAACVYVIENADDSFLSLEAGDIFAYQYDENDLLIVKIAQMEVDGTTVTITGGGVSMDEIFEYVRIEVQQNMDDAEITPAEGAVVVDENGNVVTEAASSQTASSAKLSKANEPIEEDSDYLDGLAGGGVSLSKTFVNEEFPNKDNKEVDFMEEYSSGSVKINGSVTFKAGVSLREYIAEDINYLELIFGFSTGWEITASGEAALKFPIGQVSFPTICGVNIKITPAIVFKISCEGELSGKWFGSAGWRFNIDEGTSEDISRSPVFKLELKGEISVFLGVDLQPQASLINEKILSLKITSEVGVEAVGELSSSIDSAAEAFDSYHACKKCVDGDLNLKLTVDVELEVADSLFFDPLKFTLADFTIKFGDFYYSFDYDEFDFERCPHVLYKVEIECVNLQKRPVEGVSLTFSSQEQVMVQSTPYTCKPLEGALLTDADGKAEVFLGAGLITVMASKEYLKNTTSMFLLRTFSNGSMRLGWEKSNKHQMIMAPEDHTVGITVTDDEGNPVFGAKIYTLGNGTTQGAATKYTDLNGYAALELHNGTYDLDITKSGYQDGEQTITVSNADQELTVQLISDPHVRVNVTDENGNPVTGAEVVITGDSDYTDVTNANGICKVMVDEGEYAMTVSAEGYDSQECMFTFAGKTVQVDVVLLAERIKIASSAVSLGNSHSAAITEDGSLYMWGYNYYGQLGNGTTEDSSTPIKILDNVAAVSLGPYHSAAITEDDDLYLWGSNRFEQLGNGTTEDSATPIKIMDNVATVSFGYHHSAAITKDGSLYMWGYNDCGQLGNGTTEHSSIPIKIMDNVAMVSLGYEHSAAITEDGSLYMWGYNDYGQLGDGTETDSSIPIKIMDNVTAVSLGFYHSAAITEDGSLYMWGNNKSGKLGNGTTKKYSTPIKIMDYTAVVSLGHDHSAAITEDGSLFMWGDDSCGQLGDGTTEDSSIPIKIMDNVATVNLGSSHSAAITEDGSLYMWGDNSAGQLGNGTTENSSTAIKIMDNIAIDGSTSVASLTSETLSAAAKSTAPLVTSGTATTKSYADLMPDTLYNFYVLRSDTAENLLSADNLLYLNQYVSASDGTLDITYTPIEDVTDAVLLAVPAQRTISGASIVLDDLCYDGTTQTASPVVTYGGVTLTEGTDYTLSGDTTADAVGAYTLTITGMGDYTGELTVSYWMYCEHEYADNVCTICGGEEPVSYLLGDLDEDGQVNAVDAAMILVAAASVGSGGESGLTETQELAADVNGDGECNAMDAAEVLRYAAAVGSGYTGTLEEFLAA